MFKWILKTWKKIDPFAWIVCGSWGGNTGLYNHGTGYENKYTGEQRWYHKYPSLHDGEIYMVISCLLYTSPSPRDGLLSRMPSSA